MSEKKFAAPDNQSNQQETTVKESPRQRLVLGAIRFGEKSGAFLKNMSEKGKAFASRLYEKIYQSPGINRLAAKLEIAANQTFIDLHQRRYLRQEKEFGRINRTIEGVRKEKTTLISEIKKQNKKGLPQIAKALELELEKTDAQLWKLENKKRKMEFKMSPENRANRYIRRKNEIADRIFDYYQEKNTSLEQKIAQLKNAKEKMISNDDKLTLFYQEKLGDLEQLKIRWEEAFAGLHGGEVKLSKNKEYLSYLKQITAEREKIEINREQSNLKVAKIEKLIKTHKEALTLSKEKQKEFAFAKEEIPNSNHSENMKHENVAKDSEVKDDGSEESGVENENSKQDESQKEEVEIEPSTDESDGSLTEEKNPGNESGPEDNTTEENGDALEIEWGDSLDILEETPDPNDENPGEQALDSRKKKETFVGGKISRWNELAEELYGDPNPFSIESEENFREEINFNQGNHPDNETLIRGFYKYLSTTKNLKADDLENLVGLSVKFSQKENE